MTDLHVVTKQFDDEKVTIEVINSSTEFKWRLSIGKTSTLWTSHYSGICSIPSQKYPTRHYIYLMEYWNGTLPIETILKVCQD